MYIHSTEVSEKCNQYISILTNFYLHKVISFETRMKVNSFQDHENVIISQELAKNGLELV